MNQQPSLKKLYSGLEFKIQDWMTFHKPAAQSKKNCTADLNLKFKTGNFPVWKKIFQTFYVIDRIMYSSFLVDYLDRIKYFLSQSNGFVISSLKMQLKKLLMRSHVPAPKERKTFTIYKLCCLLMPIPVG